MPSLLLLLLLIPAQPAGQSVDEFTRQAAQNVEQHQWTEAIRLLEEGLRLHPDHPRLLEQLGTLLVQSGRTDRGETLLRRFLEIQPDHSEALRGSGEARFRQGDLPGAIELLRQSIRHGPNNSQAHHFLAFLLLAGGREPEALEHARISVEINPLDAQFHHLYSLLLEAVGKESQAEEHLRAALRLSPGDPRVLFQLSERRRLAGRTLQALEYMELASASDPENPLYHDRLAGLYREVSDEARSDRSRERAAGLSRAFEAYIRAMRLAVQGQTAEAIRILSPEVEAQASFSTGMLLLADLYQKSGREREALRLYLRIVERDPFQTKAREEGAWIQARNGLLEAALQLLADSGLQSLNRTLIAGYQQMVLGRWEKALAFFREVESENPLHPELLQLISHCLRHQGKGEEALVYLAKADSLRPGDPEIRDQMRGIRFDAALNLLDKGEWQQAVDRLEPLFREDVQAEYLLRMGYAYQQLGELEDAVQKYSAGLEGDPSQAWARINLASSLYLLQRYSESALQWERILADSGSPDGYYQLGMCYFQLERIPEAERALTKAVDLGNQRPEVLYSLGLVRLRGIRADTARELIRRSAAAGYAPARKLLSQLARGEPFPTQPP